MTTIAIIIFVLAVIGITSAYILVIFGRSYDSIEIKEEKKEEEPIDLSPKHSFAPFSELTGGNDVQSEKLRKEAEKEFETTSKQYSSEDETFLFFKKIAEMALNNSSSAGMKLAAGIYLYHRISDNDFFESFLSSMDDTQRKEMEKIIEIGKEPDSFYQAGKCCNESKCSGENCPFKSIIAEKETRPWEKTI